MRQVIGMLIDTGARLLKEPKVYKTLRGATQAASSGQDVVKVVIKHHSDEAEHVSYLLGKPSSSIPQNVKGINPCNALPTFEALDPQALLKKISPTSDRISPLAGIKSIKFFQTATTADDLPLLHLKCEQLKPDSPWDAKIDYHLADAKKPVTTMSIKNEQTPKPSIIFKFKGDQVREEAVYRFKPNTNKLEWLQETPKKFNHQFMLEHHPSKLTQSFGKPPKLNPKAFRHWDYAHGNTNGVFSTKKGRQLKELPKKEQLSETLFDNLSKWQKLKKAHPEAANDLLRLLRHPPGEAEFRINTQKLPRHAKDALDEFHHAFNTQNQQFTLTNSTHSLDGKTVICMSLRPKN